VTSSRSGRLNKRRSLLVWTTEPESRFTLEEFGTLALHRQFGKLHRVAAAALVAAAVAGACAGPVPATAPKASTGPTPLSPIALPTRLPDVIAYADALPLYEYDRSAPFDLAETAAYPAGDATVHDVTYRGANGQPMPAYLVVPSGPGPFAGVVWMGWSGSYSQIREEFVQEASQMADRGVVSLLVSGYFPWYFTPTDIKADRMGMIGQVRELRRAVDLLVAQSGVDASRIAFVGHSMAAMHGANLTAVDHRVKAAVLMGPSPTMTDWIFQGYGLDPATETEYRRDMASFDPIAFVPHATPSALFFQFARDDDYVPEAAAEELYGAASQPKKIGWYEGGHELDDQARTERDAWLATELGLPN
jgi:dienelactone hydrolase